MKNAAIISVFLATNKTVFTKYAKDMAQWHVYLTIGNLSHEIQKSQVRPKRIIVGLIPMYKDDLLSMKMEIYHQTMKVISKNACNHRPTNITNKH